MFFVNELKAYEILVHTISAERHYYKDVITRTEDGAAFIDKRIDAGANRLYTVNTQVNDCIESISVTRDIFEAAYKQLCDK